MARFPFIHGVNGVEYFFMKPGNRMMTARACLSMITGLLWLLWVLAGSSLAQGPVNVCNSKVAGYLRSVGFSQEDVRRICTEARISVEAYQAESNWCEALARQIEEVWSERHPTAAMDMRIVKHAVDLACPRVCNANIAKYLRSVGIQTHSITEICELAETLVAQEAMAKREALKKALREKSTTVFQISDQVIREAVQLVEENRKGS